MYWPSPNRSMPVSADPTQSLTAPSGSARAEVVPTSQRTSHPREEKSERFAGEAALPHAGRAPDDDPRRITG